VSLRDRWASTARPSLSDLPCLHWACDPIFRDSKILRHLI